MNSEIPLLSICIPTYNRADVLDETLKSLFKNPDFDENKIEVVVSDNCSTDNTYQIVLKYPFVRYYRNQENIRDRNFSKVLSYANGHYIRLFNDTLSFKTGSLRKMMDIIETHLGEDCNLFFYRVGYINHPCKVVTTTKTSFIKNVSIYVTSIANFGVWKKDFDLIIDKDRRSELQFVQVDWSFRLVENNKKTIIYMDDYFEIATLNKKGGYNLFNVFVNHYLYLFKIEQFSLIVYETEKFRLCRYFIYSWLQILIVDKNDNFDFQTEGVYKILFKRYWYEPYFYPMLILIWIKKILRGLNRC